MLVTLWHFLCLLFFTYPPVTLLFHHLAHFPTVTLHLLITDFHAEEKQSVNGH